MSTGHKWSPLYRYHTEYVVSRKQICIMIKMSFRSAPIGLVDNILALPQVLFWRQSGCKSILYLINFTWWTFLNIRITLPLNLVVCSNGKSASKCHKIQLICFARTRMHYFFTLFLFNDDESQTTAGAMYIYIYIYIHIYIYIINWCIIELSKQGTFISPLRPSVLLVWPSLCPKAVQMTICITKSCLYLQIYRMERVSYEARSGISNHPYWNFGTIVVFSKYALCPCSA